MPSPDPSASRGGDGGREAAAAQALVSYVHAPLGTLLLLAGLAARAAAVRARGAALLDLLAAAARDAAGDAAARPLLRRLLAAAAAPYFRRASPCLQMTERHAVRPPAPGASLTWRRAPAAPVFRKWGVSMSDVCFRTCPELCT